MANGIFAKIRFRNAGQDLSVQFDDIQNVHSAGQWPDDRPT